MAATADPPEIQATNAQSSGEAQRFMQFLSQLHSVPSVRRVAWSTADNRYSDLWVVLQQYDSELAEQIHTWERDFRQGVNLGIDVHVIGSEHSDPTSLPPSQNILDR